MRHLIPSLALTAALALSSTDAAAQCSSGLPDIHNLSPVALDCVASAPRVVVLEGCNFWSVTELKVDGVVMSSAFPSTWSILSGNRLEFTMPLVPHIGPTEIQLTNAAGSGASTWINVFPASKPVLSWSNDFLFTAFPNVLTIGAAEGDQYLLLASRSLGSVSLPGVVDLAIGPTVNEVVVLAQRAIGPKAWDQVGVSLPSLPTGFQLHFQAVIWQALNPAGPLATTQVYSGTVLF